jgi:hypothetical protein
MVDSVKVFKHAGTDSVFTKVNETETFSFVDNNNFPTAHTFNTATGIFTTLRNGLTDLTIDLDGRYIESLAQRNDSVFSYKNGVETFVAVGHATQLTDSTFQIGADTITIRGTGTAADSTNFSTNFRRDTAIANVREEKNFKLGWFNVRDFDPNVGDSGVDATAAIQAAIIAAKQHGGGVVYFHNGFYSVKGPIISTFGGRPCHCQIYIPNSASDSSITIEFRGESNNFEFQAIGDVGRSSRGGVIIESTLTSATAGDAIIASVKGPGDDTFTKTNHTDPWFRNLTFRTRRDGGSAFPLSGINTQYASKVKMDHVRVDVNVPVGDAPDPTGTGSYGIILPEKSNHASIDIGTVRVGGYDVGMQLGEHAVVKDFQNVACNVGLTVVNSDHSSSIQTFEGELNKTNIRVDGDMNLYIANFNTEHYLGGPTLGDKWYNFVSDITFSSYTPYSLTPGTITIGNTNAGLSGAVGTTVALVTNDSSRIAKLDRTWLNRGVILTQTPSATFEANMFRGLNPSTTISMVAGGNTNIDGSNGPFLALRGNTYSATATQRGNVYIGAGNVSSPGADEGAIKLFTGNTIERMRIKNTGIINISGLSTGSSPVTTSGNTRMLMTDANGDVAFGSIILHDQNNASGLEVQNHNTGNAAEAYFALRNNSVNGYGSLELNGSGNSNSPNELRMFSGPGIVNGMTFGTTTNANIRWLTNTDGTSNERMRLTGAGKLLIGRTSLIGSELLSLNGTINANADSVGVATGGFLFRDALTGNWKITAAPGGGGSLSLGTFDGNTADAKGASISGSTLYMQSASGSNPGLMNTSTQTIAGLKTFTGGIIHSKTSGTGEDFKWYNKPEGANLAIGALYPQTGTNVNMSLYLIPRGTGVSGFHSQLTVFNDDGIASGNYGAFSLRATGTNYDLTSEKAGTGTILPIRLYTSGHAGQLNLNTDGSVSMSGAATVADDAYDATSWNGNIQIPTKNAIRDKIESLNAGIYALDKFHTPTGNSGTTETDLYSYTLAANKLSANDQSVNLDFSGVVSDISSDYLIRVYFAGNEIFNSGGVTITSTGSWSLKAIVTRETSSTAIATVTFNIGNASVSSLVNIADLTSLDFTTTNIFKVTGTAGSTGASSNDITGKHGLLTFIP